MWAMCVSLPSHPCPPMSESVREINCFAGLSDPASPKPPITAGYQQDAILPGAIGPQPNAAVCHAVNIKVYLVVGQVKRQGIAIDRVAVMGPVHPAARRPAPALVSPERRRPGIKVVREKNACLR